MKRHAAPATIIEASEREISAFGKFSSVTISRMYAISLSGRLCQRRSEKGHVVGVHFERTASLASDKNDEAVQLVG